jgi:hypothetical protein
VWVGIVVLVLGVGTVAAAVLLAVRSGRSAGGDPDRPGSRTALAHLAPADRGRVRRAVGRGRAVDDPRLAAAAVDRARYVRTAMARYRAAGLPAIYAVLAVLLLASGVIRLATTDGPVGRAGGVLMVLGALGTLPLPLTAGRSERRAAEAERANLALLP